MSVTLDNYFTLQRSLSGEKEIKQIIAQAKTPVKTDKLYFNRWQVVWITFKAPFEVLLAFVLNKIAALLVALSLVTASHLFVVLSKQVMRDQHHLAVQEEYGTRLLVPAFNVHNTFTCDVYLKKELPVSQIKDEKIRALTFLESTKRFEEDVKTGKFKIPERWKHKKFISSSEPSLQAVAFYQGNGLCRGANTWFEYLYLQTKDQFTDPRQHIIAVANLFKEGISKQASLLQSLDNPPEELPTLLKMNVKTLEDSEILALDLVKTKQIALNKISSLAPGLYGVGLLGHRTTYIKIDDKTGFIWNPSKGALDISGDQQNLLYQHLRNYYPAELPYTREEDNPDFDFVYFDEITSTETSKGAQIPVEKTA